MSPDFFLVFPFAPCFFTILSRSSRDETNGRYRWLSLSGISNELDWLSFAFYSNRRGWRKSPGATETDSLIALLPSVELRVAFRAFHEPSENAREMKTTRKKYRDTEKEEKKGGILISSRFEWKKKSICRQWIFDKAFSIENSGETFRRRERDLAKYEWKSCNEVSGCDVRN